MSLNHQKWVEGTTKYGGNKPPYLCGGLLPPKSVAYLGQGKSTKFGGIFPPPFLQCTDSAACVRLLSPPAVGSEELCTGHWAHSRSSEDPGDRLVV